MTNRQKGALGFLTLSIVAALWLVNNYLPEEKPNPITDAAPMTAFTEIKPNQPGASVAQSEAPAAELKSANDWKAEFNKCFPNSDLNNIDQNNIVSIFEKKVSLSSPSLTLEQYDLRTADNQNLVVQHIPGEELKDQVRLFSISAEDGMPDRIYDFPAAKSEISKRLQGALTMGALVLKKETTEQSGPNGERLEIEKSKDAILGIRYSEVGLEFSCFENKCKCQIRGK